MTAAQLRKAEDAYRAAFERSEAKRQARNEAIRAAVAKGMTQVEVARITGLGKARIGQIVNNGGEA
jgi:hypothetical protein